ncbi:hypothetical protein QR680_016086 [Steinernema hermaphroditum]|uniref:Uncharacterized protein n=1 Tax=Steinernema hermaphroditum TaxID=289476 RepID=A0AA39HCJ3_9BILA|nr:hypothetical protein QR680_016086 [Steinernema hermaphroditum]
MRSYTAAITKFQRDCAVSLLLAKTLCSSGILLVKRNEVRSDQPGFRIHQFGTMQGDLYFYRERTPRE